MLRPPRSPPQSLRALLAAACCLVLWALYLLSSGVSRQSPRAGGAEADAQYRLIVARLEALTSQMASEGAVRGGRAPRARAASDDAAAELLSEHSGPPAAAAWAPQGLLPYAAQPVGAKVFITYGDARFNRSKARILGEASRFGLFDRIRGWGPEDLDLNFVTRNYAILNQPRGGGFWLWKPYVIWETLRDMADGDVLMYADAGCTFLSTPEPYVRLAAQYGLVAFRIELPQGHYTKGAVFAALDMPMDMWAPEGQIIGGILLLQKRPFTSFLIAEWLRLCQDERLITDADTSSTAPNHPLFVDHRHDQSIWSLLVYKYGERSDG